MFSIAFSTYLVLFFENFAFRCANFVNHLKQICELMSCSGKSKNSLRPGITLDRVLLFCEYGPNSVWEQLDVNNNPKTDGFQHFNPIKSIVFKVRYHIPANISIYGGFSSSSIC